MINLGACNVSTDMLVMAGVGSLGFKVWFHAFPLQQWQISHPPYEVRDAFSLQMYINELI